MMHAQVVPVMLDVHPVSLCKARYPGHPRGCPKTRRCATVSRPLLELARHPFVAMWVNFDLGAHMRKMAERHPGWTDRQLRNVLYWQGTARAELRRSVRGYLEGLDPETYFLTYCPEIYCVDVTATMAAVGVELEWPPMQWSRVIALVGARK